jgi:predicted flap endonuclease-1-like 5' DNA nuclease
MPIIIKNAPSESFDAFQSGAQAFHNTDIKADDNGSHHQYLPHKIYNVSATDLAEGKGLANVVQTGWRYIIQDTNGTYHVAEVGMNEALDKHTLHYVNVGKHVNNFVANHQLSHQHEYVLDKDYEINMLRIPAIYAMAIWLKGVDHDHEFFIPIAPVNDKFEANKTYEYDAFIELLQEAAQEMLGTTVVSTPDDDLEHIEGIGPKLVGILKAAGYTTFKALASASADDLKKVLNAAGSPYSMSDPTTWPEQAKLAAEGNWEALEKLHDELKGGRR